LYFTVDLKEISKNILILQIRLGTVYKGLTNGRFEGFETIIARIHSQFESLGFVRKYDQSPIKLVNIEIRGSGFSVKSSDFLPPKPTMNSGLSLVKKM
jgi:hypothetical protein